MTVRPARIQSTPLASMNKALGIDCYRTEFCKLLTKLADLDSASRFRLVGSCEKAFAVPVFRNHEQTRVAASKILVALLPESFTVLKQWVQRDRPSSIHEVHFSLFCYMDEVQHFDCLKPARKPALKLVTRYLMRFRGGHRQACWMAADLLGDHWDLSDSLSPLLTAARNAKAPIARVAAVAGLVKALTRCSVKDRVRIKGMLQWLSTNDSSPAVRIMAGGGVSEQKTKQKQDRQQI